MISGSINLNFYLLYTYDLKKVFIFIEKYISKRYSHIKSMNK